MNNAALKGIHGLESHVAVGAERLICHSAGKSLKSFFSLFTVVSGVESDAVISVYAVICGENGKILKCIESLASAADNNTEIIAFKHNCGSGLGFAALYRGRNIHAVKQLCDVCNALVGNGLFGFVGEGLKLGLKGSFVGLLASFRLCFFGSYGALGLFVPVKALVLFHLFNGLFFNLHEGLDLCGASAEKSEGLCFGKVNYFKLNIVGKAESLKLLCGRLFCFLNRASGCDSFLYHQLHLLYFRNWSGSF